jgi:hypothetical protein
MTNELPQDRIKVIGLDYQGNTIERGYYAVSPSGNLVELPATMPLKNGWRLAVASDWPAATGPNTTQEMTNG